MKKKFRLKKNEDIQRVIEKGTSFANREFVLYYIDHDMQPFFRIGFSVSKKLGNACERNYMKRRMRQIIQQSHGNIRAGKDYVLIARVAATRLSFEDMERSISHVFRKQRLLISVKKN
ncbi:MAG: ribonuclease P protein component [Bacilli bacterium]